MANILRAEMQMDAKGEGAWDYRKGLSVSTSFLMESVRFWAIGAMCVLTLKLGMIWNASEICTNRKIIS